MFHFGAIDDRTSRAQLRFRCAVDSAALRPCAHIYRPFSTLLFGAHVLHVRALDRAGNTSREAVYAFTVIGTWDAARDFAQPPRPENPDRDKYGNTTWFYLQGVPGRVHDPAGYEQLSTVWMIAPKWPAWAVTPDWGSATVSFLNGRIILQPGKIDNRQNPIVGWRSPITGSVRLQATLELQTCSAEQGNGVVWWIDHGSQSLQTGTLAPGAVKNIDLTTSVVAGESLYVIVNDNGDPPCDTTALDLSIEST